MLNIFSYAFWPPVCLLWRIHVPPCSLQHCLQQPKHGSNLNAHQQRMNKQDAVLYTMEYYSVIKKNEIMSPAATWVDIEIVILSEISQTEKGKYHMISLIRGIFLKCYKLTYLQNRNRLTDLENKVMVTGGKSGGEG